MGMPRHSCTGVPWGLNIFPKSGREDARAWTVGIWEGSACSVSAGMAEAISEGKAWRVSIGMVVEIACSFCAIFWASLFGWVTKLHASTNISI